MNKKVAVVTGAASGLGKAIATAMGQRGDCHLIVLDKSPSVAQFAQSLGPSVEPYLCDLEDPAQIIAFGQHVRSAHGRCDILINNAGIHPKNPDNSKVALEDITLATWNAVLAVNLTAPFLMCQQLLPLMREHRWGRIVNISSRAGRTLIPNVVAAYYSATKAALMGLTRTVAEEGAPFNVTVNTVAPGRFLTPLSVKVTASNLENSLKSIPLGRVGDPDELAAVILFLTSDASSYMTGAVLDVNGGCFMP